MSKIILSVYICCVWLSGVGKFTAQSTQYISSSTGKQFQLQSNAEKTEAVLIQKGYLGLIKSRRMLPASLLNSDVTDTLTYTDHPGWKDAAKYRFGFNTQDVMLQWFKAPADLIINAVAVYINTLPENFHESSLIEVKIVMLNWTQEEIRSFGRATRLGYYSSDDSSANFISAFPDDANGGEWISVGAANGFIDDYLWSDNGTGVIVKPKPGGYNWVEMDVLGYLPTVKQGETFGIVIRNVSSVETRLDLQAASAISSVLPFVNITVPGFKFYANGRNTTDPDDPNFDPGWWLRSGYTWNMAAAVTITGDTPPEIKNVTSLKTTLSTSPRRVSAEITDINVAEGSAGVLSAILKYSVDYGFNFTELPMTGSGDIYFADLPGQSPGTDVIYLIYAEDVAGNSSETAGGNYTIFESTTNTLVFFNGFEETFGYPNSYYFGQDDFENYTTISFAHDRWAFGEGSFELFNLYNNIIEITAPGTGPYYKHNEIIRKWLDLKPYSSYMIIGDEWLSQQTGKINKACEPGTFLHDVIGIKYVYNDINNEEGDNTLPSRVMPVEDSDLGDALFDLQASIEGADTMYYDPYYELAQPNQLDAAEVLDDVEVDMIGYGSKGNEYNIAFHRTLPQGNKIVTLLYDALSLNSGPEYYWFGFSKSAPQVRALYYFNYPHDGYKKQVSFSVDLSRQVNTGIFNPETDTVYIRGSFNDWEKIYAMRSEGVNNIYEFVTMLQSDKSHYYKYFISSPNAPNNGWEELPYNSNRSIVVGNYDLINPLDYFGSLDPVGVNEEEIPLSFSLSQNYPNPFNPATMISYSLAEKSSVTLDIYNLLGEKVEELVNNQKLQSGSYEINFNADNYSSGVYFYKLIATGIESGRVFRSTKKMLFLK